MLHCSGAELRLEDLGSSNGFRFNGQRVREAVLGEGAELVFHVLERLTARGKSALQGKASSTGTAGDKARIDTLGTVRGRIGYAFDRVMPYVTGGYAGGQAEYVRVPFSDVGPIVIPDGVDDATFTAAAEVRRFTP